MQFRSRGPATGSVLGLTALATTIGVVVVYLIQIGRSKTKGEAALIMFYLAAIILLMLMAAAGLVGIRIYRLDEQSLDESKAGPQTGRGPAGSHRLLAPGSSPGGPSWPSFAPSPAPIHLVQPALFHPGGCREIHPEPLHHRVHSPRAREALWEREPAGGHSLTAIPRLPSSCFRNGPTAGDMAPQALESPPAANGNTCLREVGGKDREDKSWERAQGSACHPCFLQGNAQRRVLRNIAAFFVPLQYFR